MLVFIAQSSLQFLPARKHHEKRKLLCVQLCKRLKLVKSSVTKCIIGWSLKEKNSQHKSRLCDYICPLNPCCKIIQKSFAFRVSSDVHVPDWQVLYLRRKCCHSIFHTATMEVFSQVEELFSPSVIQVTFS